MNMTTSEAHYFSLMQAALWGTPVTLTGDVDWHEVMGIARFHATTTLVADVALRLPEGDRPSDDRQAKLKGSLRSNLFSQIESKQILTKVVTTLRENGIEPVLLKGFGLAQLYPNPALRQFGDNDLFVGLSCFHEACALVRSLPGAYTWCMEVDAGRHYNVEFGKVVFEIHRVSAEMTDPKENALYAVIEYDGLVEHVQQIDIDGFPLTIPSKEFMVFFTFFHAWHHFITTGVGWRQVSDVAMALHVYHGQINLDKLSQWLETMQLMQPWQAFGYLIVNCLGLPETEMPFFNASCRRRAQKVYHRVMAEGNFRRPNRFKNQKPKNKLLHKLHSFILVFVDFFHLANVFPQYAFKELHTSLKYGFRKNLF